MSNSSSKAETLQHGEPWFDEFHVFGSFTLLKRWHKMCKQKLITKYLKSIGAKNVGKFTSCFIWQLHAAKLLRASTGEFNIPVYIYYLNASVTAVIFCIMLHLFHFVVKFVALQSDLWQSYRRSMPDTMCHWPGPLFSYDAWCSSSSRLPQACIGAFNFYTSSSGRSDKDEWKWCCNLSLSDRHTKADKIKNKQVWLLCLCNV